MIKKCKIHRPHIMWLIVFDEWLHDYVYPTTEKLVEYLLNKYDITYEDIDVLISTEYLENSDLILNLNEISNYSCIYFSNKLGISCEFGNIFMKEFDINKDTKNLYLKVIPLEEI